MSSSLSSSPCHCSHPPLPCLWDCPSPTRTAKLPWSQPTKGTSATTEQLLGTLGWCLTAGPCAQGKPREFWAESYSPPRESGSCSPAPQSLCPAPSSPGVVALGEGGGCSGALGASTRNSHHFLSISSGATSAVSIHHCRII